MAPAWDLLVRGGTLIDAGGSLVTPGLVDLHTHVYHGLATGRHADQTCLANGVTTVVDAGSAGWMTLRGLRDYVIPTYQTRVRCASSAPAIPSEGSPAAPRGPASR
jgi:predicted amidohydrolase